MKIQRYAVSVYAKDDFGEFYKKEDVEKLEQLNAEMLYHLKNIFHIPQEGMTTGKITTKTTLEKLIKEAEAMK